MEQFDYQKKENELIECLLGLNASYPMRHSTIQLALRNATFNQDFGNDFVSLLLHLIALEQVGNLFCNAQDDSNGIVKAIQTFSKVKFSERELQGIKHLRHSLAHNYGLAIISKNEKNKDEQNYKFVLHHFAGIATSDRNASNYIIPPEQEWDGILADCDFERAYECKMNIHNSFRIFVPSLIELADEILNEILPDKYRKGKLHFVRDKKSQKLSDEEFLGQIAYKYFVYTK